MRCYIENSIAYLRTRNNPPLQIVIDSGGGSVAAGLDIYDLIRLYPGETFGIVYSRASSMATIVLQACTKRQCARHAEILIHHVSRKSVSLDSLKNPAKLSEIIQDMEKDQSRLYKILCDKTEKSEADIASECEKDTPMSAEDALEFRLIDEII
jgi:ATP-dependent protease ClpP protease subunit